MTCLDMEWCNSTDVSGHIQDTFQELFMDTDVSWDWDMGDTYANYSRYLPLTYGGICFLEYSIFGKRIWYPHLRLYLEYFLLWAYHVIGVILYRFWLIVWLSEIFRHVVAPDIPMTAKQKHMLLAEKKMEELERKNASWEHFQERAQCNAILWDFPQAWNYFRGIRHARIPWKTKRQLTQPPNQPRN